MSLKSAHAPTENAPPLIDGGLRLGVPTEVGEAVKRNDVLVFNDAHADFSAFHEEYVGRYIALADTKAAASFGVSAGLLGYLSTMSAFRDENSAILITPTSVLGAAGCVLLALSALCAAAVIVPRLPKKGESVVFWGAVSQFPDAERFKTAVHGMTASQLTDARLTHSYNVSTVCTAKYLWLRRSLWLGFAGIWSALCMLATLP